MVDGGRGDEDVLLDSLAFELLEEGLDQVHGEVALTPAQNRS